MISDRKEIEKILSNGEQILIKQPELADMELKDVINALDGTEQMIRDRWGVVALLVIKSIKKWDLVSLVKQLSLVESGCLTYEYVGYILQNKYDIDMEALLLEADEQGEFESIVRYVNCNLQFLTEIKQQYICSFLQMLEKHVESNSYYSVVSNYAKGIATCNAYWTIMTSLGDLNSRVQYDLMNHLSNEWYRHDVIEANRAMECLLEHKSEWSQKAAIDFIDSSMYYDITLFETHLPQIEKMLFNSNVLWLRIITTLIKYMILCSNRVYTNHVYMRVMEHIKKIPTDTTDAKCRLLEAIQWTKEIPQDLWEVFQSIIEKPFESNQCPLHVLDTILSNQIKKGEFKRGIENILVIFRVNGYYQNWSEFFDELSSVTYELSKDSKKITKEALLYMLTDDIVQVYFGLGWLMIVGNLPTLIQEEKVCFSNAQLIRIMNATVYLSFDSLKICNLAFQLLDFVDEDADKYIAFCMDDVYMNYPETLFEVSKSYISSGTNTQIQLAERVSKAHEKAVKERELSFKIKDLHPSWEHQYIYQKALYQQNKQINKKAEEKSVLANIVGTRTLKYGKRNAHIVHGAKGKKFYQTSPFHHFEEKREFSLFYVNDPVGFAIKRASFLNEVTNNALDN